MELTAKEISKIINGKITGNPNTTVKSIAKIEEGKVGDLCFLFDPKYKKYIYTSIASIIIVDESISITEKINCTLIKVANAYLAFKTILNKYNKSYHKIGISEKADICDSSKIGNKVFIGAFTTINHKSNIGDNVKIYPNCYIGNNVSIGNNSVIFPGVKIYDNCKIGTNNIIHSGVVIGADGFGFAQEANKNFSKINQIGNVTIGDDVEIGANTTIDRATIGSTKIRKGVKLDNLIQIGHNVEIKENTVIAAQVAIAGSTTIGRECMIGGQTAIAGHLTITDNVKIAGQSGIASSINKKGQVVQGPMAFDIKKYQRSYVLFKKLPEIYQILLKIQKEKIRNETKNH